MGYVSPSFATQRTQDFSDLFRQATPLYSQNEKEITKTSPERKEEEKIELRIFIARIPGNTTEENLTSYFSQFGEVSGIKLDRRGNGKCSGSGSFAIDNKNGYEKICKQDHTFMGRSIIATKFLDKNQMGSDLNAYHKRKVILTKVPPYMNEKIIKQNLEIFGPIENLF
jgi:RNA recognition motif-containing protein